MDEKEKILLEKKKYIFKICYTEEGRKILNAKLEGILKDKDIYKINYSTEITEALMKSKDGIEKIKQNFLKIIELFYGDFYNDAGENDPEDIKFLTFINNFMNKDGIEFINKNMFVVLQKMGPLESVDFIESLPDSIKKEIKLKNKFLYEMYDEGVFYKDTLGILVKNQLNDFIEILFEELTAGKEVSSIGEGSYSQVIKSNGYIIKIGKERENYFVPYHPKILQPLMKIRGIDEKGNSRYVIEVQNECNTKDVTEEDAQKIKAELKEYGIFWSDQAKENIGRLKKPNSKVLPSGTYDNPEQNGSYDVGVEEKTEYTGTIVITDADCIQYLGNNEYEKNIKHRIKEENKEV